jgi:hypothetical protein
MTTSQQFDQPLLQQWQKMVGTAAQAWASTFAKQPEVQPMDTYRQMLEMWLKAFSGVVKQPEAMDPAGIRKFWDETLGTWTHTLAEQMGSQEYASFMGKLLGQTLSAQSTMTRNMEPYVEEAWKSLDLPSRKQVLGVAEHLISIERRLEEVEDLLQNIQSALKRPASAPRSSAASPRRRPSGPSSP